MEIKVEKKIYEEIRNGVIPRLNNLRRWTEFVADPRYDEISKQALNCIIAFILASEAEKEGKEIRWEKFPKIALYRAFQKAYINYDVPEHILKEICELGTIKFDSFKEVISEVILKRTNESFEKLLSEPCGSYEEKIYKAATKLATYLEVKDLERNLNGEFARKEFELTSSMYEYRDLPFFCTACDVGGETFKVLKSIARLRNQNRWAAYSYIKECSVLGHLFEVAIFAYLMALEKGSTEKEATKCFFMGIFHDVPEAFTRDIPSPIKDKIPGFRALTEQYELKMMEEKVYPYLSESVSDKLKSVMFEDEENYEWKPLMKGADYLSAVSEIYRQLKAGTRDETFISAMLGHNSKFENGLAELTPNAKQIYDDMQIYAIALRL